MPLHLPRFILSFSSLLLGVGAVFHAAAFKNALAAIAASNLPPFYANSCKGLWLADSATLFVLALVFGWIAVRPSSATMPIVVLLSLVPAATAFLIYTFVGSFFAAHLLLVASAAALTAGLLSR